MGDKDSSVLKWLVRHAAWTLDLQFSEGTACLVYAGGLSQAAYKWPRIGRTDAGSVSIRARVSTGEHIVSERIAVTMCRNTRNMEERWN